MRLVVFMVLGIFSVGAAGQLSFDDVVSLENKTYEEIQACLARDLTIVDEKQSYTYRPISPCDPPELEEDSCQWLCTNVPMGQGFSTNYPYSPVVFRDTSFTKFEMTRKFTSKFASNYNHQTKAATTFIQVAEYLEMSMNNCQNELRELDLWISLKIDFRDPGPWESFKAELAENALLLWSKRLDNTVVNSETQTQYGIRRRKEGDIWKGVLIILNESSTDTPGTALVFFDAYFE